MQTKFIRQKVKKAVSVLILLFLSFACTSKKETQCGFILQHFEITNSALSEILLDAKDNVYTNVLSEADDVMVMVLRSYGNSPFFTFTTARKGDISSDLIFDQNRRVVGYIEVEKEPVIVLSNIADKYEFVDIFYHFIHPTEQKHQFDFIYFPNQMYPIPDESDNIPPPHLVNYPHYSYIFDNGRFIFYSPSEDFERKKP